MTTKYSIYDTFNRNPISTHRSLKAAVIAEDKFSRSIRRSNPGNSYIATRIEYLSDCGEWLGVPTDKVQDAQQQYLELQNAQQQYCNN
jgi:hypothetical protein